MPSIKAFSKSEVPPGQSRIIEIDGKKIAVFNVRGDYFAIGNTCPHRGGSLGNGTVEGSTVACPLHAWKFDLATGNSTIFPNVHVPKYAVKILGNDVFIEF